MSVIMLLLKQISPGKLNVLCKGIFVGINYVLWRFFKGKTSMKSLSIVSILSQLSFKTYNNAKRW